MPGSVEPVPEINCGFYTFVLDSGAEQYVVNSFTGEVATITRNADMVDMGMWFNIEYSDGGWAYLEDVVTAVQQRVDGLAWKRKAVKLLPECRLFVQNTTERTAHWLDNKDFINKEVVKTLAVNDKVKLSFSVFELDRGPVGIRDAHSYRFGGRCFWDLRCLQPHINLSHCSPETRETWVKHNFWNARRQWQHLFSRAGGVNWENHWIRSQESWLAGQKDKPV